MIWNYWIYLLPWLLPDSPNKTEGNKGHGLICLIHSEAEFSVLVLGDRYIVVQ